MRYNYYGSSEVNMISEPSFYKTEKERLERVKRIYETNVEKIEAAKYMGKDEGFELVRYLVSKNTSKLFSNAR